MTQSDPDYSLYNLELLYDIYRHIDKRRFPERAVMVRQQIVIKQGVIPTGRNYPPCLLLRFLGGQVSRQNYRPSNALRAARAIVGLEYGALIFFVILPLAFFAGSFTFILWPAIYLLFFSGTGILRKWLGSVRDQCTVELWSLIALGLAPLSAILYTIIAIYPLEHSTSDSGILFIAAFFMPFVGFYTPFILAVFWVKYHCREDEF